MFVNYYALLEIDEKSVAKEIKIAFKKQALKWHPDRNLGNDTNKRMQEINEAYLILNDLEARKRYSIEYQNFKQFLQKSKHKDLESQKSEKSYEYSNYEVKDEILNKWINRAKKQAIELAKQTIEDFKGIVSIGVKSAKDEIIKRIVPNLIIGIVISLISVLYKSCSK
ncbi:J domain-containing protein [Flavobacterium sp. DSR2-3-3]|uniref:J domain-containing protein n=1 Tax=Flavobacterium sp. DSR2-3-3 TaxID=2804632 RepID=UPI003CF1DCC3